MLEGLQDYAKIQIVKKALKDKGDKVSLKRLEQAIQKLKVVERTAIWNQYLNEAKALLNELSLAIAS